MKTLNELAEVDLTWHYKYRLFVPLYELRTSEGEVVGSMSYRRRRWWEAAIPYVEALGNRYEFWSHTIGHWYNRQRYIRVVSVGLDSEVARYWFRDKRLEFPDGREFFWKLSSFWSAKYAWTTSEGTPIIGFAPRGMFKPGTLVSIDEATEQKGGASLMIYLGWYLLVLQQQETAATAATIAAIS